MKALVPDSVCAMKVYPSPNHGARKHADGQEGRAPDCLVLHYTGMDNAALALQQLCNPAAQVSAHYFVFEDGRILQLVPEIRRAWHAGAGCWQGERDMNSASIGVEIVNPGHANGYVPFPAEQIEAVQRLCADIIQRWQIKPDRVIAHSDMAPLRKEDPGELFPWASLHAAGIGHFVSPHPISGGRFLSAGEQGQPVEALQAMFALYGYDLPVTGNYDELTMKVVMAFQRHFRPERVDGIADASTIGTLRDLIRSRPD